MTSLRKLMTMTGRSSLFNMDSTYNARFETLVRHFDEDREDRSSPTCKELIYDPATPDIYRAWSHLVLACTDDEPDCLHHAILAEYNMRLLVEEDPDDEICVRDWELAQEILERAELDDENDRMLDTVRKDGMQRKEKLAERECVLVPSAEIGGTLGQRAVSIDNSPLTLEVEAQSFMEAAERNPNAADPSIMSGTNELSGSPSSQIHNHSRPEPKRKLSTRQK